VQTRVFKTDHREDIFDGYSLRKDLPVLLLYNINPEWPQEDIDDSKQTAQALTEALRQEGHPVTELCLENQDLVGLLRPFPPDDYIVFNVCEEIPGFPNSYDLIAQTLEVLGFTFTGADSKALAFSQDKRLVKQRLNAHGINTPRWQIFTSASHDGWRKYPAIVKPALEHCSVGLTSESVVWSAAELASRIGYVIEEYNGPALVEEFIDGREFTINVIGNGRLHVLPVAEFDFSAFDEAKDRLLTYEYKFDPESKAHNLIEYRLPATLTREEEKQLSHVALEAYHATDCRDYARLDIRLLNGTFYILDINPNADIRPDSSPAMAAELVGWSYGKFGSLLVNLAAQRHPVFGAMRKKELVLE
jgi:D-alanine-D-alanine ligase